MKTRCALPTSRSEPRASRAGAEVRASEGQLLGVTEFMHPRLQEVCDTLPAALGRRLLASKGMSAFFAKFFGKGRHVETTSLRWFLMLRMIAAMRSLRPRSLRYVEEQERIEAWLETTRREARRDVPLATEIARCQRLVKGYGDTLERGLGNFRKIMALHAATPLSADTVRHLRELALADESGDLLTKALEAA